MAGPLKTLFGALQASTYLSGVSLAFGEEEIDDQTKALPLVVMVPKGGPITDDGYEGNGDSIVERRWKLKESVEFWLWNFSTASNAQPIDHADATESLRALVLAALQDQRAQYADSNSIAYGLLFQVESERWDIAQNTLNRFGRGIVLTVNIEITVPTPAPQEATINTFQLSQTVQQGPS